VEKSTAGICSVCGARLDSESNFQHEQLLQHLRGLRDIVINTCFGGFGLSYSAQVAYLDRAGIAYTVEDRESRDSTLRYGPRILVNGLDWNDHTIPRDDPILVSVVQDLKEDANSSYSKLTVVKIPADVSWIIEEYDGKETVAEQHRTWR
jgi:hypothetical protein